MITTPSDLILYPSDQLIDPRPHQRSVKHTWNGMPIMPVYYERGDYIIDYLAVHEELKDFVFWGPR